ncbi:hypothetical protein EYZ11_007358 [Aspergillus tanneri]|uniref:VOC domain-containing protein n=1 Tax=Aspergillus tanneri TaxID=1220188 RepID=A0A4S3JD47_9EURO|nr:uncharacterized protein ATNIH1004_010584 [Aspergillus tanneri]KAA8643809.1 hypothetical protein ATNIH1004_010584 [Aspergillus tanneri]THC93149.1 hypothetical protein EYZ11_007358 [Aspergillus tanneri]
MSSSVQSAWKIIPMFHSLNISHTVDFYTQRLGFEIGEVKPDPSDEKSETSEPYFCSLFIGKKADANLYFSLNREEFKPTQALIALGTVELDEYYKYLKCRGDVEITDELEDTDWGWRWFTIKDDDGNSLTFFKFLEGGNPGE